MLGSRALQKAYEKDIMGLGFWTSELCFVEFCGQMGGLPSYTSFSLLGSVVGCWP